MMFNKEDLISVVSPSERIEKTQPNSFIFEFFDGSLLEPEIDPFGRIGFRCQMTSGVPPDDSVRLLKKTEYINSA